MPLNTDPEVNKALNRLLKEIEVLKEQARQRGYAFHSLNEEQLVKKLRGETSNSPFFTAYAWDQLTNSGSPSFYLSNFFNPDPSTYLCYVTIFFGIPLLAMDASSALASRDTRWPMISTELITLNPGDTGIASLNYEVPYVPKSTYFFNHVLWGWPDTKLFDSGNFWMNLAVG